MKKWLLIAVLIPILAQAQDPFTQSKKRDIANVTTTDTLNVDVKATVGFMLELARGNILGMAGINKFGRSTNNDSGIPTDVWDGANATDDIAIWVAPTTARIHAITSTSDADSVTAGGARTIQVYGLTSWDAAEVSEVVSMDGVTGPNTANAYVIIHRMQVLTKGATSVNVGVISATAATDGTLTAQINAGTGQTHMAIYGVPSTQTAYMGRFYANFNRSGGVSVSADVSLEINPEPDVELINFVTKHTFALVKDGTSALTILYSNYKIFSGPAIIKVQVIASAADLDISAGFDVILVDN